MKKDFSKNKKEDLKKELEERLISLRDLRFGVAGSKSKNVKEYRGIRKDVARLKTLLNNSK